MKYSGFFSKKTIPKLCINCKFFINSDTGYNKYRKCSLFPKEHSIEFLITGVEVEDNDYSYCYSARINDGMCGKKGKKYEEKLSENADLKSEKGIKPPQ